MLYKLLHSSSSSSFLLLSHFSHCSRYIYIYIFQVLIFVLEFNFWIYFQENNINIWCLSNFRILCWICCVGAESVVYEATLYGKRVAVKKPVLSTSDDLDKFHKELQLLWYLSKCFSLFNFTYLYIYMYIFMYECIYVLW